MGAVHITQLIDNFQSIAVVLLRNGTTASELRDAVERAERQVVGERTEANARLLALQSGTYKAGE